MGSTLPELPLSDKSSVTAGVWWHFPPKRPARAGNPGFLASSTLSHRRTPRATSSRAIPGVSLQKRGATASFMSAGTLIPTHSQALPRFSLFAGIRVSTGSHCELVARGIGECDKVELESCFLFPPCGQESANRTSIQAGDGPLPNPKDSSDRVQLYADYAIGTDTSNCRISNQEVRHRSLRELRRDSLRMWVTRLPSRSSAQPSEGWLAALDDFRNCSFVRQPEVAVCRYVGISPKTCYKWKRALRRARC